MDKSKYSLKGEDKPTTATQFFKKGNVKKNIGCFSSMEICLSYFYNIETANLQRMSCFQETYSIPLQVKCPSYNNYSLPFFTNYS